MNFSDTEVAMSILLDNGFLKTNSVKDADVILVMTCSIRESAEDKIWKRLKYYQSIKQNRHPSKLPLKIGILGCMAERLKTKILEREKIVDLVCGPDAYRDLPRLLAITESNQSAANVQLSLEETYSDISPVRINPSSKSAFVSIMRGCDNMCAYCIVPFTRGRERSRPISSIRSEISKLAEQGVKEVVLLGQNVNSYRDTSERVFPGQQTTLSNGFKTVYKTKQGGLRFSDLLDKVSLDNPEIRFRFTSPHPKDFPDEVLYLIKERANIGTNIHLPAQSGNNAVLENMRRGYTREAYLKLVDHIRSIIPDVALTSDFIAGFCGETEEAHLDTISLLKLAKYEYCFSFMYSMREKTQAFHRLVDDVPLDIKKRRLDEIVYTFRELVLERHKNQIGQEQLVLVEGISKRSESDLYGRNDRNTKVIFPNVEVENNGTLQPIQPGDYIVVKINNCSSQVLKGNALTHSSITEFTYYQVLKQGFESTEILKFQ
ncbi:hypothetical protein LOTGIDRAFT_178952 [Lottia gigantea]|uniref:CDK5 regulatory subunit-associated protein 1 n=1 Tax=Lottia gigantea TaxID=225164 RepID=V4A4R5_LOTGI|nr:hypothetical protein LOTGIDRAFT_178952 [Lottia gigantea]ESO89975.1 hypothetical protein LOTGIDRAFT_178952 [Lottia gigantea]